MNVKLCNDHFERLANKNPCSHCPSQLINENRLQESYTVTPEEYRTLMASLNDIKTELKADIKGVRDECIQKFQIMDTKEDKRVKDIYDHIDAKIGDSFAALKTELEKKADKELCNDLKIETKEQERRLNTIETQQASTKTKFVIMGSTITILAAGFIGFLFNHFQS